MALRAWLTRSPMAWIEFTGRRHRNQPGRNNEEWVLKARRKQTTRYEHRTTVARALSTTGEKTRGL